MALQVYSELEIAEVPDRSFPEHPYPIDCKSADLEAFGPWINPAGKAIGAIVDEHLDGRAIEKNPQVNPRLLDSHRDAANTAHARSRVLPVENQSAGHGIEIQQCPLLLVFAAAQRQAKTLSVAAGQIQFKLKL
jgi:hypothetical protein